MKLRNISLVGLLALQTTTAYSQAINPAPKEPSKPMISTLYQGMQGSLEAIIEPFYYTAKGVHYLAEKVRMLLETINSTTFLATFNEQPDALKAAFHLGIQAGRLAAVACIIAAINLSRFSEFVQDVVTPKIIIIELVLELAAAFGALPDFFESPFAHQEAPLQDSVFLEEITVRGHRFINGFIYAITRVPLLVFSLAEKAFDVMSNLFQKALSPQSIASIQARIPFLVGYFLVHVSLLAFLFYASSQSQPQQGGLLRSMKRKPPKHVWPGRIAKSLQAYPVFMMLLQLISLANTAYQQKSA